MPPGTRNDQGLHRFDPGFITQSSPMLTGMSPTYEAAEPEPGTTAASESAGASYLARTAARSNAAPTQPPAGQGVDERIVDCGWGATLRLACIRIATAVADRIATAPRPNPGEDSRRRRAWAWAGGSLLTAGAAYAKSRGWV
jgi:hypothetical protein